MRPGIAERAWPAESLIFMIFEVVSSDSCLSQQGRPARSGFQDCTCTPKAWCFQADSCADSRLDQTSCISKDALRLRVAVAYRRPTRVLVHMMCRSEGMGPIAYLRLYKIEVRVKQVPYEPKFMFAFTGMSAHVALHGFGTECCWLLHHSAKLVQHKLAVAPNLRGRSLQYSALYLGKALECMWCMEVAHQAAQLR